MRYLSVLHDIGHSLWWGWTLAASCCSLMQGRAPYVNPWERPRSRDLWKSHAVWYCLVCLWSQMRQTMCHNAAALSAMKEAQRHNLNLEILLLWKSIFIDKTTHIQVLTDLVILLSVSSVTWLHPLAVTLIFCFSLQTVTCNWIHPALRQTEACQHWAVTSVSSHWPRNGTQDHNHEVLSVSITRKRCHLYKWRRPPKALQSLLIEPADSSSLLATTR